MKLSGLELIKAYREHPERFLPMVDKTEQTPAKNEYDEINIGWNAGMLDEKRPYFAECWAAYRITMLTLYVSTKGIEDMSSEALEQWFQDIGYYHARNDANHGEVLTFKNKKGEEFYSINIVVGTEDEPARITGAPILSWSILNEYNRTVAKN